MANDIIARAMAKKYAIQYGSSNFVDMVFKSRDEVSGISTYTMTFNKSGTNTSYDVQFKDGATGLKGDSNYDLAVSAGYTGTLNQYLDSLGGFIDEYPSLEACKVANPNLISNKFALINDTVNETISIATYNPTLNTWSTHQATGLSAYKTAINNGFVGTETEWLQSLDSCLGKFSTLSALKAKYPTADVNKFAILVMDNGQVGIAFYDSSKSAWDVTVFTSENGVGGELILDGKSIQTNTYGNVQLFAFENAGTDAIPVKKSDGTVTYLLLERDNLNQATAIASKEYVYEMMTGGLVLQDDYYDASTNIPNVTTTNTNGKSFAWIVNKAGTQTLGGDSITFVKNDVLIKTPTDGYLKIDNSSQILSWGSISGTITNQTDLINLLNEYCKIDDADTTSTTKTFSIKKILELVKGKKTIYIQSTTPSPVVKDDLWVDTSVTPYMFYAYDGTVFQEVGGSGNGLKTASKNASFTASVGYLYMCDVTSNAISVTMPITSSLKVGDIIEVMISVGDASVNNVTLLLNTASQNIESKTENFIFDINSYFEFRWVGGTIGWKTFSRNGGVPQYGITGEIKAYPNLTPPNGYLVCQGQTVSRETYANLFTVIGTTFGAGANDGLTFTVPDYRGKTLFGYNSTDANFNAIGKSGGATTHKILLSETPSHSHTVYGYSGRDDLNFTGNNGRMQASDAVTTFDASTSSVGGDQPMSILNPYSTVSYVIKY